MDELQGVGEALDATVDTDAEVAAADHAHLVADANRVVEHTQRKVDKQREHLAGAEAALAVAVAARDALTGGTA